MDENKLDEVEQTVNSLCRENGLPPSISEVAERTGLVTGTVHNYLKRLVELGRLAKRDGKYLSLELAEAWPVQDQKERKLDDE